MARLNMIVYDARALAFNLLPLSLQKSCAVLLDQALRPMRRLSEIRYNATHVYADQDIVVGSYVPTGRECTKIKLEALGCVLKETIYFPLGDDITRLMTVRRGEATENGYECICCFYEREPHFAYKIPALCVEIDRKSFVGHLNWHTCADKWFAGNDVEDFWEE